MTGPRLLGLDMAQAEACMRLMGMKRTQRQRLYGELLEMEAAALAEIYGNGAS